MQQKEIGEEKKKSFRKGRLTSFVRPEKNPEGRTVMLMLNRYWENGKHIPGQKK